jgi:uncharacterized protein YggE
MMLEELKKPLILVTASILIFFIIAKVLGPIPFTVKQATSDVFTTDGEGEAQAIPTEAQLQLGITRKGKTVDEVKNAANQIINTLTKELKDAGIAEKQIKTTNYSLYPEYDTIRPLVAPLLAPATDSSSRSPLAVVPDQNVTGYTVSINMQVTADSIEKANKAMDLATKAGANQIGGVQFVLSDETKDKLRSEARTEAIAKAKQKAKDISRAAGIRLGRITNIYESNSDQPQPMMYSQKSIESGAGDTELNPGQTSIKITVTLTYETL